MPLPSSPIGSGWREGDSALGLTLAPFLLLPTQSLLKELVPECFGACSDQLGVSQALGHKYLRCTSFLWAGAQEKEDRGPRKWGDRALGGAIQGVEILSRSHSQE